MRRAAASFVVSIALAGIAPTVGTPVAAAARELPPEVTESLQQARVPPDAVAVAIQEAGGAMRVAHRAQQPVNPASLLKLATTYAALDLLGPAYTWITPVWLDGTVHDGVLDGRLVIQGRGDPKLVTERLWLLLRRVRALGVAEIRGDIVLDRSAFVVPERSPAEFDGEPFRPYNVQPDALLVNYKSLLLTFTPDPARGVAAVAAEPPLAGVRVDASVPLADGPCLDWRAALRAELADPSQVRFAGAFPATCGERSWAVAYADPKSFNARAIEAMWRELGGRLSGAVVDGRAPAGVKPSFEVASPTLGEVVREINKFSSNVMAQQLYLTLALERRGTGTPEAAREVLRQWLVEHAGEAAADAVLDNGSGLSRDARMSAALLARLLQRAWSSAVMPELVASLPVSGLDGTLRRSKAPAGRAHLKTGSLRDVAGIAGYVLSDSGRRYVLVAIIQHPNANAPEARAALDALVRWTARDLGAAR